MVSGFIYPYTSHRYLLTNEAVSRSIWISIVSTAREGTKSHRTNITYGCLDVLTHCYAACMISSAYLMFCNGHQSELRRKMTVMVSLTTERSVQV